MGRNTSIFVLSGDQLSDECDGWSYPNSDAAAPTAPTIPPAIIPVIPMALVALMPRSLGTLTVSHNTKSGGNCVSMTRIIPRLSPTRAGKVGRSKGKVVMKKSWTTWIKSTTRNPLIHWRRTCRPSIPGNAQQAKASGQVRI